MAQKRRRDYRVSGFHGMKRALSGGGTAALDGRSAEARAISRWSAGVEADLGGDLTTAERTLLEVAAVDVALLAVADTWLRANADKIVNRRRRTLVPLVGERLRVASHLAELLKLLGLKRRARPVDSLEEALARAAQAEDEATTKAGTGETSPGSAIALPGASS